MNALDIHRTSSTGTLGGCPALPEQASARSSVRASFASSTLSEVVSPTEWVARHYDPNWEPTSLQRPASPPRPRPTGSAWSHARKKFTAAPHTRVGIASERLKQAEYYLHHVRSLFPASAWNNPDWPPPRFVRDAVKDYHTASNDFNRMVAMETAFRKRTYDSAGVAQKTADIAARAGLLARGALKSTLTGAALLVHKPVVGFLQATAPSVKSPCYQAVADKQAWRHNVLTNRLHKEAVADVKRSYKAADEGLAYKRALERNYQSSKIAWRAAAGQIPAEYRVREQPMTIPQSFRALHWEFTR